MRHRTQQAAWTQIIIQTAVRDQCVTESELLERWRRPFDSEAMGLMALTVSLIIFATRSRSASLIYCSCESRHSEAEGRRIVAGKGVLSQAYAGSVRGITTMSGFDVWCRSADDIRIIENAVAACLTGGSRSVISSKGKTEISISLDSAALQYGVRLQIRTSARGARITEGGSVRNTTKNHTVTRLQRTDP